VLLRTIISDKVTALTAAQAISSALYARKNGRGGQQVHVSMLAATAAFSWVDMCRDEAFLDPDVDILPLPTESYRLYRFADGWATVAPAADGVFVSMLRAFGVEDTDDPRIQTLANRMKYPEVAARAMELWQAKIANIPLKEGIARLEAIDVPCAPSLTLAELAMHPHVVETGVFIETEYPGLGLVRETRPAAHFSGTPEQIGGAAPSRGQHTASVLSAAGIDIAAL
jgi:crotonobetainyl-CoA:carnitine CoA-transferase CaiB-like acyl-CoA transferase